MLLVRTDGGPDIGMGHVMRCLALAEAWRETGDEVLFAMRDPAPVKARLEAAGVRVDRASDLRDTIALARRDSARFAVVDGYHLEAAYQDGLREAGLATLVIDDNGEIGRYSASVLLNANPFANPAMYPNAGATHTRLLLGLEYALLRREFRDAKPRQEDADRASNILVTLGGADPARLTPRVLRALGDRTDLELLIVAGPANPHVDELRELAARAKARARVVHATNELADAMAWADVAVAGAGTTCWELARMGVPTLAIVTAENQRAVAASVEELGFGVSLGQAAEFDEKVFVDAFEHVVRDSVRRREISQRGRACVDGLGALRVRDALLAAGGPS